MRAARDSSSCALSRTQELLTTVLTRTGSTCVFITQAWPQETNTRDTMMAAAWLSGVITASTLEQCHQPPPICSDDKKVGVKRFFDPTKLPLLVSQIAPDLFTDPFSAPPLLLEYLYRLIK